jgi:aryl-alcohol dehydrogenase-like predicted oxidoreductase
MKGTTVLNRREFNRFCASASACLMTADRAFSQSSSAASSTARIVKLRDGRSAPALGQGSARLAHGRHPQSEEEAAMRSGIELGMTLIDTAEIYGSEELVGRVIAGQRDRVFLVSKVWPNHVALVRFAPGACPISRSAIWKSCFASRRAIAAR